jgi:hypothetical protein
MNEKIKRNKGRCISCGTTIESYQRNECVFCTCKRHSVDGGLDYLKRSGDPADFEELSVMAPDIGLPRESPVLPTEKVTF